MTSFQSQVNAQPAPGVEGDFCSVNPRFTVLSGPGAIVAGNSGVTVGRFAWLTDQGIDFDNAPAIANNFGVGPVAGFVHREQQGLNTTYLAESAMTVPQGFPVTLFSGGDFWVKNNGTTAAQVGQKAYAKFADGSITFAATGSATTTQAATSTVSAQTFSVTGSITGNLLTVTAVTSGTIVNGATISGTGIATGTQIVAQLTPLLAGESTGGIGRYAVSITEQSVASTAVSGTYGLLTVGAAPSNGNFVVGGLLTGGTVAAGTQITQLLTGSGGNGSTFAVNTNTASASATLTETLNVETKFIAMSAGAAGELIKITDHALG